nr:MAG TPA: hypothetical protein [Caudoviricetes sp.]
MNSHTLYSGQHFCAENAKCDFVFTLVFPGQSGRY